MSVELAFELTARISMFAIALSSAEWLAQTRQLRDSGLMSWEINSLRQPWYARRAIASLLDAVLRYPNVIGVFVVRLALAAWLALCPLPVATQAWAVVGIVATGAALTVRCPYGQDGADQMAWVVSVALMLTLMIDPAAGMPMFLCFVAGQAIVSYSAAGYAKLVAPQWRDGSYLPAIFRITPYGHAGIARALDGHPLRCRWLAHGLLAWECGFVLVLLLPPPLAAVPLAAGAVFHASSAYAMGLNCFFWAFVATYPAIFYVVERLPWWR